MKHKICIALALTLATVLGNLSFANAQTHIGGKIGYTYSKYRINDVGDDTTVTFRPGYTIGAFVTLVANTYFVYHGELSYTQKGVQFDSESDRGGALRIDYIEAPQILNIMVYRSRILRAYTYLGISPAFSVYGRDFFYINQNFAFRQHVFKDENRFQFAGLLGAGGEYEYRNGLVFSLDFRYYRGLTPVDNNLERYPRERNIAITAGVKFIFVHKKF